MDPRPASVVSSDAKHVFAGWLARVEDGETLDFEAELARAGALEPELRLLHARWQRMQGTLAALDAGSDALDSAEEELLARFGGDPAAAHSELGALAAQPFEARYELRGPLGRGGMGIVERVFDRVLQREVAVKHLRRTRGSALRRFLAEARLVAALDHPGPGRRPRAGHGPAGGPGHRDVRARPAERAPAGVGAVRAADRAAAADDERLGQRDGRDHRP